MLTQVTGNLRPFFILISTTGLGGYEYLPLGYEYLPLGYEYLPLGYKYLPLGYEFSEFSVFGGLSAPTFSHLAKSIVLLLIRLVLSLLS